MSSNVRPCKIEKVEVELDEVTSQIYSFNKEYGMTTRELKEIIISLLKTS